jgi:hypothetical protein
VHFKVFDKGRVTRFDEFLPFGECLLGEILWEMTDLLLYFVQKSKNDVSPKDVWPNDFIN